MLIMFLSLLSFLGVCPYGIKHISGVIQAVSNITGGKKFTPPNCYQVCLCEFFQVLKLTARNGANYLLVALTKGTKGRAIECARVVRAFGHCLHRYHLPRLIRRALSIATPRKTRRKTPPKIARSIHKLLVGIVAVISSPPFRSVPSHAPLCRREFPSKFHTVPRCPNREPAKCLQR